MIFALLYLCMLAFGVEREDERFTALFIAGCELLIELVILLGALSGKLA